MDTDTFVALLAENQPRIEELVARGYPQELAIRLRRGRECTLRTKEMGLKHVDPLWDLIDRYDVSKVEIGFIRFEESPQEANVGEFGSCLIFAAVDADFLASTADTGKVLFLDGCHMPYVMGIVAENGGRFLDALIEMIEGARAQEDRDVTSRRCAELAGSEGAFGFFQSII